MIIQHSKYLGTLLLIIGCASPVHAFETRFDMDIGQRTDALRWNIASDITGEAVPNILSELTWEDVQSKQLTLAAQLTDIEGPQLRVAATYGWIYQGDNQDSDYIGDDRTQEFSRSNNDAAGDEVWDASLAFGYRLRLAGNAIYLTPLLGFSHHAQDLRMSDGNQTIPDDGPFSGLDSTYQTEWSGVWLGLELEAKIAPHVRSYWRAEVHKADYNAEANWNLRDDFNHPKSFEHKADGRGIVLSTGFYLPAPRRWSIKLSLDYQHWITDPGTDRVFFADGTTSTTRLNEVEWSSWSASAGIQLQF